jgi:hypothetical protein
MIEDTGDFSFINLYKPVTMDEEKEEEEGGGGEEEEEKRSYASYWYGQPDMTMFLNFHFLILFLYQI